MSTKETQGRHRDNFSRRKDSYRNCKSSSNTNRDFCMEQLAFGTCIARMKVFYPSNMVNQMMGVGISPLATELANHSLSLAGRLQHFTHNSWMLKAGLQMVDRKPHSQCVVSSMAYFYSIF